MTNIAAAITEVKALLGQRLNTSKSVCELHGQNETYFPKMLPNVISWCPPTLANTFTISSGAEVPKATIVKPIAISEIDSFLASDDAPSIKKSAHLIRITNPNNKITIEINIIFL